MRTAKPDYGEKFRHMDHVVNLVGIDHVDFGPDWIVNMAETAIGMQSPLEQMFFDDNGYSILQDMADGEINSMMFRSVHTVFKPPASGGTQG